MRLSLAGEWWDSLLYMGRWYLVARDGSVRVVDWQNLIESLNVDDDLRLAVHCAFARGDALYGARWKVVFDDPEIRAVLQGKFERLGDLPLTITRRQLDRQTIAHEDAGFSFPYSDAATYARGLWIASPEGLEVTGWDDDEHHLSTQGSRIWDTPVLALSPNYGTVALAAGDEGLHELHVDAYPRIPKKRLVQHCSSCDWLYYSIYASSHVQHSTLAAYNSYATARDEETGRMRYERVFDRAVDESTIFTTGNGGYSWGSADKICKVASDGIHVARYSPGNPRIERQFANVGRVDAPPSALQPIDGAVAHYGIVIEVDDGLFVVQSNGELLALRGAPVNWRTFQRSKWYANQLHVVRSGRVEILSFHHDFFLDQTKKVAGIRFRERSDPRSRRR